jgi:predicted nuclease of predicted toxin-antitoxin system
MAIKFHLDEHIDPVIAIGLRRRRIDVTTTVDAGLLGALDIEHVEFAKLDHRVILTYDPDFLRLAVSGVEHDGIVFVYAVTRTIGQIIEYLAIMHGCMDAREMINHVDYF